MKIEIKNRYTRKVIFKHEQENNSIKATVELAVKIKIDLSYSDLSYSDLSGSNLIGSNLSDSIGNMKEIFSMQLEQWAIVFTKDMLVIGCQSHKHDKWKAFNDDEISQMSSGALEFWKKWKEFIFKAIELSIGESK